MKRVSNVIAVTIFALVHPWSVSAQQIIRAERRQLDSFAVKIRGMPGAVESISAARTPKVVRDAVMDSVVAILNLKDPESAAMPRSEALSVMLLAADSKNADIATGALNRLTGLALDAETPAMRLNGLSAVASFKDRTKSVPILKRIATSNSSVASDAVQILGASYGAIGLTTLKQIYLEKSAKNKEAQDWVESYAARYKWTR